MIRTFGILRKIEMTEQQNQMLDEFVACVVKNDIEHEIDTIYLCMLDTTNGVLNDAVCPIVFTNTAFPSDKLYEAVKAESAMIPEYFSKEELLPADLVILWKRED